MWWIPLLTTAASLGYDAYKTNQMKNQLNKPSKQDFLLNKRAVKSDLMGDLFRAKTITDKNIKQVGAAKKMPSGAIASALGNANYNLAKGAGNIESELARTELQGNMNFQNAMNQYQGANLGITSMQNQSMQGALGNLSKVLMLWEGGYFDQGPDVNAINQNAVNTGNYGQYQFRKGF